MTYYLVLDLETAPAEDVPAIVSADAPDRCPAAPHHRIVSGAVLTVQIGERVQVHGPRLLGAPTYLEAEIAADALGLVAKGPIVTGCNIRGFDLPVLIAAAMRHGLRAPVLWSRDIWDRYRGDLCLDLQDALTLNGAGRPPRMGAVAQLIGWPGKSGIDGSDVARLHAEGRHAEIQAYNLTDVVQEAAILARYMFCRGGITREDHDAIARALMARVEEMPELRALRGVDAARALLGDAP